MMSEGSVTHWIRRAKQLEDSSADLLYERFFERLSDYARPRISSQQRPLASEEDVAQSVLHLFCQGVRRGSFHYVKNRHELWSVLVRAATRKIIDNQRRHARRRALRCEVRESEMQGVRRGREAERLPSIDHLLPGPCFEPEFLVTLQDEYNHLLQRLKPQTRKIAKMILQGSSIEEIAQATDLSRRSVERKVRLIHQVWLDALKD